MSRAVILMIDSLGVGHADDADQFGEAKADTLGHIIQACAAGTANRKGLRNGPLNIPNLSARGLVASHDSAAGLEVDESQIYATYGHANELSYGKDTPSGHWEMAGLPVLFDWGYFRGEKPCFPNAFLQQWQQQCALDGVLGECHASGTEIIAALGDQHIETGKPIVYTSADSVFQVAAHEDHFGLERLLDICRVARKLLDKYQIGRVIARPFTGDSKSGYARTGNRRDFGIPPHEPTLLDVLTQNGGEVVAIGKISDIYAKRGISKKIKATGIPALFDATLSALKTAQDHTLVFTNLVDFDSEYGHRRDIPGYAAALEYLDTRLPELDAMLRPEDVVVLTADHGCDPSWPGSDHTREQVPVVFYGPNIATRYLGQRDSFADIGQTLAEHFRLPSLKYGVSMMDLLYRRPENK